MIQHLKKQDIFMFLIISGIALLVTVKLKNDKNELRQNFILTCEDYSVRRIENTCRKLQISGFEDRKTDLQRSFKNYCTCVVDVWEDAGLALRPEFYWNVVLPQSQHTEETLRTLQWMRSPNAKSGHARCQSKAQLNLNWIPAALKRKQQTGTQNQNQNLNPPVRQTIPEPPGRR